MSRPEGGVNLTRLLEAVNSLAEPTRREVLAALKEHDPHTHYYTLHDGRVDAVKHA
jgi:hypothetical protein